MRENVEILTNWSEAERKNGFCVHRRGCQSTLQGEKFRKFLVTVKQSRIESTADVSRANVPAINDRWPGGLKPSDDELIVKQENMGIHNNMVIVPKMTQYRLYSRISVHSFLHIHKKNHTMFISKAP